MGQRTIKISETAYADLEDIENYISLDSPKIARRFIENIFERLEQLYEHPDSGRKVPEFIKNKEIRELILNKYRIIYKILNPQEIVVLRIIHGSRLLDLDLE